MIPKIIHYCWLGGAEKPKLVKKCIKSWKKYCKGYQIIEWNETNFDIDTAPKFVQDAYKAKKWAFVSDYVRLKVVYDNGGVYLDTDVQLIKKIDKFLNCNAFFGVQFDLVVASGLGFGAEKNAQIIKDLLDVYEKPTLFFNKDKIGSIACPNLNAPIFKEYGFETKNEIQKLKDETLVYPPEYFCPMDIESNMHKTKNTVSIHHFEASWEPNTQKRIAYYKQIKKEQRRTKIRNFFSVKWYVYKILGEKNFNRLKKFFKKK